MKRQGGVEKTKPTKGYVAVVSYQDASKFHGLVLYNRKVRSLVGCIQRPSGHRDLPQRSSPAPVSHITLGSDRIMYHAGIYIVMALWYHVVAALRVFSGGAFGQR